MAQILVVADTPSGEATLLNERVVPEQLESEHFAAQLVERIRWAAEDATNVAEQNQAPADGT
jgi:hypothetical protein